MSIIDDALKKTQDSLSEKKDISGVHGENQDKKADPGRKTHERPGKKVRNIYVILCISAAVGAMLYTIYGYYGLPLMTVSSEHDDQPVIPGQSSVPVPKDNLRSSPDQSVVIHHEEEIEKVYAEGLSRYEEGNFAGAMESLRKAAEKGHAGAQNTLGIMYLTGRGVKLDYAEAAGWCRMAAEQLYTQAQYNLGIMYYKGTGGAGQDYKEAAGWYLRAAEQGHAGAQTILGLMYSRGQGVGQDYAEAVKWYRRAAEHGYAVAQYNLGVMFSTGRGVEQDHEEALKWYTMAADQGHADSQAMLDQARMSN